MHISVLFISMVMNWLLKFRRFFMEVPYAKTPAHMLSRIIILWQVLYVIVRILDYILRRAPSQWVIMALIDYKIRYSSDYVRTFEIM